MLQNAYLVAKIGADTAENEQQFAEILPTDALWLASKQRGRQSARWRMRGSRWPKWREKKFCSKIVVKIHVADFEVGFWLIEFHVRRLVTIDR